MMRGLLKAQTSELQNYIVTSNDFYQDLLGYKPEETSLKTVQENDWEGFVQGIGFNPNSSGIYLPRNQTAIIRENDVFGLFHEYFGHGIYCEQSLVGRELVNLEKKLLEAESKEFERREFTLDELEEFRNHNQTARQLEEFRKQNLGNYELFAVWTEYFLSEKFGLENEFERRYESFAKEDKEVIDSVIDFSEVYGDLATFYAFGLKKIQDKKRLLRLSQDIFGKSLDRAPLVLHFGSGKPFSDIDLFVVSNNVHPIYDHWIDVRTSKVDEIEKRVGVLDPKVTDPIMIGGFIFGNRNYRNDIKQKILSQQITEKAINYNLERANYHKRKSLDNSLGKHLQNKNLRSAKTYLTNALAMKNGDKILTFNGLVDYSHALSQSESFIELKGGIE